MKAAGRIRSSGLLREDGKIKVLVCVVGDTVGIATFPGEPEESRLLMIDGRTMPGGRMSPYNEGKALTHELDTSDSGTPSTPAAIPLSKETSLQTHHWRKRRIRTLHHMAQLVWIRGSRAQLHGLLRRRVLVQFHAWPGATHVVLHPLLSRSKISSLWDA